MREGLSGRSGQKAAQSVEMRLRLTREEGGSAAGWEGRYAMPE